MNIGYLSVLCSMNILCNIILIQCLKVKPRVISTRYGQCKGMIIHLGGNLKPVEVFSGFQFASTKGDTMRFIPPVGSLEKWLSVRMFSSRSFRGVCSQTFSKNVDNTSTQYNKHLKRIEPYTLYSSEDCLNLNLHVPVKGKISDLLQHTWG